VRRAVVLVLGCALLVTGCGLRDPYTSASPPDSRVHKAHTAAMPARALGPVAAARSFMRGYLQYLYGLGSARAIASATPQLRRALAAQPMTRDDGASPSHPRIESLRLLADQRTVARVRAVVSDESGVYYAVDLALVRRARGWRVGAVRMGGS
jgi:hypothetical protein